MKKEMTICDRCWKKSRVNQTANRNCFICGSDLCEMCGQHYTWVLSERKILCSDCSNCVFKRDGKGKPYNIWDGMEGYDELVDKLKEYLKKAVLNERTIKEL